MADIQEQVSESIELFSPHFSFVILITLVLF